MDYMSCLKELPADFITEEQFVEQYQNTPEELKKLWKEELDLLAELKRVCDKYGLRWFADGGTLLGAVRHRGFIPWDDDIDILIFAEDYDKFCQVAPEEFKEPYFFQTWESEECFFPRQGKLRSEKMTVRTHYDETYGKHWKHKGVFLDVYGFYYIPKGILKYVQLFFLKLFRSVLHGYEIERLEQELGNRYLNFIFKMLYHLFSPFCDFKKLSRMYVNIAAWQKKPTDKVGVLAFDPGNKKLEWNSEWYASSVDLRFMDTTVPAPVEWDLRLRTQYGDYMTPKKGQARHGDLEIVEQES